MTEPGGRGALAAALDRRAEAGKPVTLWWRDDDATDARPELARLLALAAAHRIVPVLATIPALAGEGLLAALEDTPARLAMHGIAHENRAPAGEKRCELTGAGAVGEVVAELAAARQRLAALAGRRLVPMLVPPWNRIGAALLPHLSGGGFSALSTYGSRRAMGPAPGVTRLNAHLDPIDWRGGRGTLPADTLFGRLADLVAVPQTPLDDEPIGLLTHHLAHDTAGWGFIEALLDIVASHPGVRWLAADRLPATPVGLAAERAPALAAG